MNDQCNPLEHCNPYRVRHKHTAGELLLTAIIFQFAKPFISPDDIIVYH